MTIFSNSSFVMAPCIVKEDCHYLFSSNLGTFFEMSPIPEEHSPEEHFFEEHSEEKSSYDSLIPCCLNSNDNPIYPYHTVTSNKIPARPIHLPWEFANSIQLIFYRPLIYSFSLFNLSFFYSILFSLYSKCILSLLFLYAILILILF